MAEVYLKGICLGDALHKFKTIRTMLEEKDSWVAGLLHDCLRFISVVAFFVISAVGAVASGAELPVRVVFDTDLGNDIDDALALQMLINYENEGRIQIAGISLSKANPLAADVVVDYYRRFGSGNPEFGYVGDGPNPEEGNFLRPMFLALNKNQNQNQNTIEGTGKKKVCKSDAMDEGWKMLRRVLMSSPDSSGVFIAVGPATNLARLLDSAPDSVSPLSGVALVAQKVRRLCLMGGNYSDNASAEWNVLQDLPSMQRMFEAWPGEIVASGFEVGNGVVYSHENILEDFAPCHPLRVGYENFIPMPYDRPCWDLTAVLCAVEPGAAARYTGSARRAVDQLVALQGDFNTEGEITYEDGMVSCSALQMGAMALHTTDPTARCTATTARLSARAVR